MRLINLDRTRSTTPINTANNAVETITMLVELTSSFLSDQETFCISTFTSVTNFVKRENIFILTFNYKPWSKMAGQEGFEPPSRGFGDRCSAN